MRHIIYSDDKIECGTKFPALVKCYRRLLLCKRFSVLSQCDELDVDCSVAQEISNWESFLSRFFSTVFKELANGGDDKTKWIIVQHPISASGMVLRIRRRQMV